MPGRIKDSWSSDTHAVARDVARTRGSVTHKGEQRARERGDLDPLVDPKAHGVIRKALNLLVPEGEYFILQAGVAMPVKSELDTTGSMGGNVEIAFEALPKVQNLLVQGPHAVLRRYHVQIATGVIQDECDMFAYEVGQFEPDNEVDRQMGLLVPNRGGGDNTEDYQLGLFSTAYLTETSIRKYGLKGYYFCMGDEIGRDSLNRGLLERVFGPEVFEKAFGSAQPQALPTTVEIAKKLLEDWHVFFLQVGNYAHTTNWWSKLLGRERIIHLPRTEDIAEVQALIIGLTEGVLDLHNAVEFLTTGVGISSNYVERMVRAVAHIPVGAQTKFQNFGRIPMKGARFSSRDDIWPMDAAAESTVPPQPGKPAKDGIKWKL